MSAKSLDTNVILRLLLDDVPEQTEKVTRLFDGAPDNSLMVADVVFFECAWLLASSYYSFSRELIGKMLMQVTTIPQINCNRKLLQQAVPLYVNHPAISFIDACLSVYAELNRATPLLTFDKKLAGQVPAAQLII